MARFWLVPIFVLASCATHGDPRPQAVLYDGYGGSLPASLGGAADGDGQALVGDVDVDDIEPALAEFLSPAGRGLILLPDRLDIAGLDYSIASLKLVDAWLRDIHTINRLQGAEGKAGEGLLSDGRGDNSVMFAGLYLGEVIRRNSRLAWEWQRFDRFVAANPDFAEHYGRDAGLDSFVLVGPQGAATPINTALKRVLLGKEESLHFVATLLVEPLDIDAAMAGQDFYGLTED